MIFGDLFLVDGLNGIFMVSYLLSVVVNVNYDDDDELLNVVVKKFFYKIRGENRFIGKVV